MTQTVSRRTFAAGVAITAASSQRILGANDRIGIGIIGLGNISRGHLQFYNASPDTQITAVCDIYKRRLDQGMTVAGPPGDKAKGYHAYEDLLADPNVDAVIICTPDHWHAPMAIDAMRAGKDVDVEKPMAITIDEAQEMVRVAAETKRILAVDSEHMAHGIWGPARTAVAGGVLGKLVWSQTSRSRNAKEPPWNYPIDADASPENLDWERWLGSTAKVPFSKERFFRWRRFWEYGGGIATDLYYHHLTPLIEVTERGFPIRGVSGGGNYVHSPDVLQVPDTHIITLDFENNHTIVVGGSLTNSVETPIIVRGSEANLFFHGPDQRRPAYLTIVPEEAYRDTFRDKVESVGLEGQWIEKKGRIRPTNLAALPARTRERHIASLLTQPEYKQQYEADLKKNPSLAADSTARIEHFQKIFERRAEALAIEPMLRIESPEHPSFRENFLDCIRTRKQSVLDGELGYRSQVAVVLGVESFRQDKVMRFDPASEKLIEA